MAKHQILSARPLRQGQLSDEGEVPSIKVATSVACFVPRKNRMDSTLGLGGLAVFFWCWELGVGITSTILVVVHNYVNRCLFGCTFCWIWCLLPFETQMVEPC